MLSTKVTTDSQLDYVWWLTIVYGPPQIESEKMAFLAELLQFRSLATCPWLICGDFNMIYRAQDKNNDRLDRTVMRRFRNFINQAQLKEINMVDRRFTWSKQRGQPTLELLDRVFASSEWLSEFPNHVLRPLSSDSSDHCPLLLQLNAFGESKGRFRFEPFWVRLPGFCDMVANAWASSPAQSDPFRTIDAKLRNVAKALMSWSASNIGSLRLQLTLAPEAIFCFDIEKERRTLEPWEFELRRKLKMKVLGARLAAAHHCAIALQDPVPG
jgi:hypothetical protein